MNEPPNSRYFAAVRSGQPIVWMTLRSGFATFQISLTPSSHTCGSLPREPEVVERDAGQMTLRSLGEHRHLRDEVGAGLEVAHRLALAVAALVAGADADDAAVRDEQLLGGGLGQDHRAALLGLLAEPAAELREREDDVAVVAHRRRRRDAQRLAAREHVDRLAVHRAVARHVLDVVPVAEEAAQRARVDDRARQQVRAGLLALLDDRHRHLAELVGDVGVLLQQLAEPDRAREAGRAGADDQDPDLDPLVGRIGGLGDELARAERRRIVGGANGHRSRPCAGSGAR